MTLKLRQASLAISLLALSFQAFAQPPASSMKASDVESQFNYQSDYICNAKLGNLVTTGNLDVATLNTQRFGFPYPVQIKNLWLKASGETDWHRFDFDSTLNFTKYKGIRFALNGQNSNCQNGQVTTQVSDNPKKEAVITAEICTSTSLKLAQVQILFEAIN